MVLAYDGTVWVSGVNNRGQLGDSTTASKYSPFQIPGLSNMSAIGAGGYHSMAYGNKRTWAWGDNTYGEIGDSRN
ncbi:MAG: hypothetical protein IH948_02550 [Bacteroidetes bacterium]|nr:hypothetical protein [Bacteroidota bacterium]